MSRRAIELTALVLSVLAVVLTSAATAAAEVPRWRVISTTAPANLAPGSEGVVTVLAYNVGDVAMPASSSPIKITDRLPAGLKAIAVHASLSNRLEAVPCTPKGLLTSEPSCTDSSLPLQPYTGLRISIAVRVETPSGTRVHLPNKVLASGGEAPATESTQSLSISPDAPAFGIEKYELKPENEDGTADAQAGSHPFQLTTVLTANENGQEEPVALPENLRFTLPAGLIGNPNAVKRCSQVNFNTILATGKSPNLCGPEEVVGVAAISIVEPASTQTGQQTYTVPVFNLEPAPGEPARFGFVVDKVPVVLTTAIQTGHGYNVVVTAHDTSQAAGLAASLVTFWGEPGDPRHDSQRGWACVNSAASEPECAAQIKHEKELREKGERTAKPFLSLPTSCGTPLSSPMQAQSWNEGAAFTEPIESEYHESLGGCEALQLSPGIGVQPDVGTASTPTGLSVNVTVAQNETPGGLAAAAVKSTTVTLPAGVALNPGAANGLLTCSALQMGLEGGFEERQQLENDHFTPDEALCLEGAKVGTVAIKSPDLEKEVDGSVYLASEGTNPFEPPLVLYMVAYNEELGVRVKLAGTVVPDPATGQLVSTFEDTPEVPFESLRLHFFGDHHQSVSTPPHCGEYATTASFTPWSGSAPTAATLTGPFKITSGPGGGPCPSSPLPFNPSFSAGSNNLQAGAFTPFSLTIGIPDEGQRLTSLTTHLPPGAAAMLSSVTPCPIATADVAGCGPESLIGHSTGVSGLGDEPYSFPGTVYLTGGFDGAPYGISVVTPAVAGPFNLGTLIANSTIQVDKSTAAVTVTTVESLVIDPHGATTAMATPVPTIVKGAPVQLKHLNVRIDRPNFEFNPTSCNPMQVTGTAGGAEGASANVASNFQVANCGALPFNPGLTVTAGGIFSRVNGTSFDVTVTAAKGEANIAKTKLVIPQQLPSRLTTIQKACMDTVFNANPASCDEGSNIGYAIVHTPVLKNPLTGPAYLVSHGGAEFPDVEFVLQGEGILLILDGKTKIHNGVTTSEFNAVPDAPVSSFEAILPAGPHSALSGGLENTNSLCATKLVVPTTITGQNGALIERSTPVNYTGCKGVAAFKETNAQKLAKALKSCRKKYKKNKHKRQKCEAAARKKYGPHKKSSSKKKKK